MIIAFTPNSPWLARGIGYAGWLVLNLATVLSVSILFKSRDRLNWLITAYLWSFTFVAAFGIFQFASGLLGWDILLRDRLHGLPRVNAFSFEPSYFATYMLTGLAFATGLLVTGVKIVDRRTLVGMAVIMAIAIILSTSRIGWVMLALLFTGAILVTFVCNNRTQASGAWMRSKRIVIAPMLGVLVVIGVTWLLVSSSRFDFLLEGTGIGGQSAHSSQGRRAAIESTIAVFKENPLIGVSLGGVGPAVARVEGRTDTNAEGINVFAEVLAASGLIGAPFFFAGLVLMILRPLAILRGLVPSEGGVLFSLVLGAVVLLLMLQFNQNILRTYVWIHFAILGSAFLTYLPCTGLATGEQDVVEVSTD